VQVIGKDILAPSHGIYYLTILKYLELKLPFKLLVHNWWLINEVKISKSLGNGLDLAYLILKYKNARLFNFFIIKEFNLNKDSVYSFIQFKKDYRYYYANLLLNLISRVKSIRNTISFKLPPSLKLDYIFHMYKVRLYSFQKKFFINIKRMSIDLLVKEFFIMIKKLNHY
jgi:methionyl-tRNA synthetase